MSIPRKKEEGGLSLIDVLKRLPALSYYPRTRGWHYLITWLHRLTGVGLILMLAAHLFLLSSLPSSILDRLQMAVRVSPAFLLPGWVSSVVVGFHALNGCRLMLYELFGVRNEETLIRWVFGLTVAYAAVAGLIGLMRNQRVSPFFMGLMACFLGAVAAYAVGSRIRRKRHSVAWGLQRTTGAFLFATVPAYLLFLYLNPGSGDGARAAVAWIEDVFLRMAGLIVVASALYHAGYGLFSIVADSTSSGGTRTALTALIVVVIAVLTVLAIRLILWA